MSKINEILSKKTPLKRNGEPERKVLSNDTNFGRWKRDFERAETN